MVAGRDVAGRHLLSQALYGFEGGKSEISKALSDAILPAIVFVADLDKDLDAIADILARDFSDRFLDPKLKGSDHRLILSSDRSMGSVIKLFDPVEE